MADAGSSEFGVLLEWERRRGDAPSPCAGLAQLEELSGFCRTQNAERGDLCWRSSLICPQCGCKGEVATF